MKNNFTLIELLVVIAVISILLSILISGISKAKGKAFTASCKSNLSFIGTFSSMHLNDNSDYMMPSTFSLDDGSQEYSWVSYLSNEYNNKNPDIFLCPALTADEGYKPHGANNFPKPVGSASYIMNTIHNWADATISTPKGKSFGWGVNAEDSCYTRSVNAPSTKIFITDTIKNISSADAKGIVSFRETDHGELPTDSGSDKRDVGNHHNERFNSLMGDMHVETIKESEHDQWVIIVEP